VAKTGAEQIGKLVACLRVEPGSNVTLAADFDPAFKPDSVDKTSGQPMLEQNI
jgi:hypothetical protein